jgi:hypothetical protein
MNKRIQKAVTFIKATREEAMELANDIVGDAEVHALVVQPWFSETPPEPVGYMVVPVKEWVGLMLGVRVDEDSVIIKTKDNDAARELCGELLKEKNT